MAVTIAASPNNFRVLSSGTVAIPTNIGSRKCAFASIALDTSYPTGGYTVDPSLFGLNFISLIVPPASVAPAGQTTYLQWNVSTRKLQAFTTAGAEVANATNLSAVIAPVVVSGF